MIGGCAGGRPNQCHYAALYAGSFALGVASGLMGDRWSMGFLVETERQVGCIWMTTSRGWTQPTM